MMTVMVALHGTMTTRKTVIILVVVQELLAVLVEVVIASTILTLETVVAMAVLGMITEWISVTITAAELGPIAATALPMVLQTGLDACQSQVI